MRQQCCLRRPADSSTAPILRNPELRVPVMQRDMHVGYRLASFISTRTPGLVITPAQDQDGVFTFKEGCCVTHGLTGYRVAGVFHDIYLARLVASALGGVLDWSNIAFRDVKLLRSSINIGLISSPSLLDWVVKLNECGWDVQTSTNAKGGAR